MRRNRTGVGVTLRRILPPLVAAVAILVGPGAVRVLTQVPSAVAVEGRVLDAETGAAIPDAVVLAEGAGAAGEGRAITDAGGGFSLLVSVGRVTVQVVAPGYFPLTTTLDVGDGGLAGVELSLAREAAFATDAVVLAEGAGAAGEGRAITDAGGGFSLLVSVGRVTVQVVAPGYFPLTTTLDVGDGGLAGVELSLAREAAFATSVDVVASAPGAAPATEVVQPSQVLRTPGAADNIYRTLQTLPGVAATEEFGSRLAVRGGAPDQNLTVMDGVEIHDPYRLFGLTTAFNPETIQRFELATGGFSVEYGDRLSSLLVVENRDGRRDDGLTGSASLSITDTNLVLEGPLPGDAAGS